VPAGDKKGRGSLAPAGGHDGPSSLQTAAAMEGRGRLKLAGVTLAVYGLIQVLPSLICLVTQAFHGFTIKVSLPFQHLTFQFFYNAKGVKHCFTGLPLFVISTYLSIFRNVSTYKI
jgi:hypothetical protein